MHTELLGSDVCIHAGQPSQPRSYVWFLYASPCALLLLPWLGELEGTSLAMVQASASPVLVVEPIFRVPPVLRSGADGELPTARRACDGRLSGPSDAFLARFFAAAALSTSH